METVKILLVQTINNNLGDPIIGDNNCYLLKKAFESLNRPAAILRYRIDITDPEQIRYVDAVVFAGGIIKATTEKFWRYFTDIIETANRYDIPVFLSAIGVEPYVDQEEAFILKRALNLPCVKAITCRDDINSLKRDWITNKDIAVSECMDPAIWTPETYQIPIAGKTGTQAENRLIGLGVIRPQIFEEYGHPEFDKTKQTEFWKKLVGLLEERGEPWAFFTNGALKDEQFARELVREIGHGRILPAPVTGEDLVKNIHLFSGIIGARMHSNILAYSLGIPSIGIIWNQKILFWGARTGCPERMIEIDALDPESVMDALMTAMQKGVPEVTQNQLNAVYLPLLAFAEKWCTSRRQKEKPIHFQTKMTAFGLGAIEKKNPASNSAEAFIYSYKHNFRIFKTDIRFTSDDVLVCINKWEAKTLDKLGVSISGKSKKLKYKEFQRLKWYDRFTTITFQELLKLVSKQKSGEKIDLILDIGKPNPEDSEKYIEVLKELKADKTVQNVNFYLKIEQEDLVQRLQENQIDYPVIYLLPDTKGSKLNAKQKDILYFCHQNNIRYLSVKANSFNDAVRAALDRYDMYAYIISTDRPTSIIEFAGEKRIKFIGSNTYDVDYMEVLAGGRSSDQTEFVSVY